MLVAGPAQESVQETEEHVFHKTDITVLDRLSGDEVLEYVSIESVCLLESLIFLSRCELEVVNRLA